MKRQRKRMETKTHNVASSLPIAIRLLFINVFSSFLLLLVMAGCCCGSPFILIKFPSIFKDRFFYWPFSECVIRFSLSTVKISEEYSSHLINKKNGNLILFNALLLPITIFYLKWFHSAYHFFLFLLSHPWGTTYFRFLISIDIDRFMTMPKQQRRTKQKWQIKP